VQNLILLSHASMNWRFASSCDSQELANLHFTPAWQSTIRFCTLTEGICHTSTEEHNQVLKRALAQDINSQLESDELTALAVGVAVTADEAPLPDLGKKALTMIMIINQ
jgi:hypothetical protein